MIYETLFAVFLSAVTDRCRRHTAFYGSGFPVAAGY